MSWFVAVLRALILISHPRKPTGISSGLFTLAVFDFGRDFFFCPVLTNCPRVSEDDSSLQSCYVPRRCISAGASIFPSYRKKAFDLI